MDEKIYRYIVDQGLKELDLMGKSIRNIKVEGTERMQRSVIVAYDNVIYQAVFKLVPDCHIYDLNWSVTRIEVLKKPL